MKTTMLIMAGLLLISGCKKNVNGRLEILEDVALKTKKGEVRLTEGTYQATLEFRTKKKLVLKLKEGADKGQKVLIKIPKGTKLSAYSGRFSFNSAEAGQPYNISGNVNTETTTSDLRRGVESCTEIIRKRKCRQVNGERVCETRSISIPGKRFYTYFYETDTRVFEIDLENVASGNKVANFDGTRRDSRTVRLHSTGCITRFASYRYGYRHCSRYGRYGRIRCN